MLELTVWQHEPAQALSQLGIMQCGWASFHNQQPGCAGRLIEHCHCALFSVNVDKYIALASTQLCWLAERLGCWCSLGPACRRPLTYAVPFLVKIAHLWLHSGCNFTLLLPESRLDDEPCIWTVCLSVACVHV